MASVPIKQWTLTKIMYVHNIDVDISVHSSYSSHNSNNTISQAEVDLYNIVDYIDIDE